MDVELYLNRINYNKQIDVSKEVLFELQAAHLLSIPFENLDIHYNQKIKLDIDSIFQKIVINNRGGFCYELNGLFYHLLKEIGFDVQMISGKVYSKDGSYGEEFDHLAIIANVNKKRYLVDVGFGKFSFKPLEILFNITLKDKFGLFMFDYCLGNKLRINTIENGNLTPQYIFEIKERAFLEFGKMCEFHQTSKDSHFKTKKVVSIVTHDGRVTLNDNQIKITEGNIESKIEFEEDLFNFKLKEYFNMEINGSC